MVDADRRVIRTLASPKTLGVRGCLMMGMNPKSPLDYPTQFISVRDSAALSYPDAHAVLACRIEWKIGAGRVWCGRSQCNSRSGLSPILRGSCSFMVPNA